MNCMQMLIVIRWGLLFVDSAESKPSDPFNFACGGGGGGGGALCAKNLRTVWVVPLRWFH